MDVNQIIQGDALEVLSKFPDASIQCCVTSPPYFGLRDYGVEGQIGLEETPEAYVSKLVEVFREMRRVLRNDGTLWLNIGDSYAGGGVHSTGRNDENATDLERRAALYQTGRVKATTTPQLRSTIKVNHGLKPKDLIGIPWMVAFALRADGWYLRSDIIWNKPTAMPESVTDRPTKAHEYLFLFAKSERYYYDADSIREPLRPKTFTTYGSRNTPGKGNDGLGKVKSDNWNSTVPEKKPKLAADGSLAGANKRTVWTVASQPFSEAHFATFPPKLIEPCILAGTSPRACEHCLAPWERVTEQVGETSREKMAIRGTAEYFKAQPRNGQGLDYAGGHGSNTRESITTGWQPTCTCPSEGTGKCIVLDPFMGAGTTALVAIQHGRNYLGIELNPSYIDLANRRINTVQQNLWSISGSEAIKDAS